MRRSVLPRVAAVRPALATAGAAVGCDPHGDRAAAARGRADAALEDARREADRAVEGARGRGDATEDELRDLRREADERLERLRERIEREIP